MLVVLALVALPAQAFAEGLDHLTILSADELQAFSKATGFGATVQTFSHESREETLVMRSYTSGVRSSDLHVFIRLEGDRYSEVLSRAPIWGVHLAASQVGDVIHVVTEPSLRELLSFTISGCFGLQEVAPALEQFLPPYLLSGEHHSAPSTTIGASIPRPRT